MSKYLRDDIFFCPDCRQFHKNGTHEVVEIPGMDVFYDPDTGKSYKIRKTKPKKERSKNGFG